jgi:hypothetical protein
MIMSMRRNLDDYSRVGDPTLDNFAPGWRDAPVDGAQRDREKQDAARKD